MVIWFWWYCLEVLVLKQWSLVLFVIILVLQEMMFFFRIMLVKSRGGSIGLVLFCLYCCWLEWMILCLLSRLVIFFCLIGINQLELFIVLIRMLVLFCVMVVDQLVLILVGWYCLDWLWNLYMVVIIFFLGRGNCCKLLVIFVFLFSWVGELFRGWFMYVL